MARVVVIGAGVGGLAAALRLAAAGHDVTVCEQAPAVGGKLGLHAVDGYRFDTGPSLLTNPEVLADTIAAVGQRLADHLDLHRLDPVARYRFADGTWLDLPADRVGLLDALASTLGDAAAHDWNRFLDRCRRIWDAVAEPFLETPVTHPAQLARQAVRLGDLRTVAPWRSLRELARAYLRDPRLVQLVDRYATYTGSDPRRAPAALASIVWAEHAFGAWYVRGGMYRIAEVLADLAARSGATIRLDADVTAVTTRGGRASGVRLADGEQVDADLVVANADATHLYDDLVAHPRARGVQRRLRRTEHSLSGFALLLGVRDAPDARPAHHTVLFPRDYDAEFDALFPSRGRRQRGEGAHPVTDPTLYVAAADDPAVSPPGQQAWFVLANAPRQGQAGAGATQVDWHSPGMSERYADQLLDLLGERGLPVADRVTYRALRSPAELAARTRAVGGAIYGTSSNGAAAAFARPRNRSPVPDLLLVGGSAHPGGGLPLVLRSARMVADLVDRRA